MTPENQGDDLSLRWGVAVIVTGQVPPLPPAVREPVLPIVLGAEHPVQAEEQEDQDNARGQTQSSHPGGRDRQTQRQKEGERKDPITSPRTEFEKYCESITRVAGLNFSAEKKSYSDLWKIEGVFLMGKYDFQKCFQTCQEEKYLATKTLRKMLRGDRDNIKCVQHSQRRTADSEGKQGACLLGRKGRSLLA